MDHPGRAIPDLRRAASADELARLESMGELPLLDDAIPDSPTSGSHPLLIPADSSSSIPSLPPPPPPPRITDSTVWAPVLTRQASRSYARQRSRGHSLKGPLRAARLCLLAVLLPGILVAVPLYMRFHVYSDQVYPLAMSDMRLLDGRVSTTWCQRQVVRANATFNAFLMPEQPHVAMEPQRVSMVRDMVLDDDMKEYWAFYLLRGSSITVSACVSWPGASLVVIRGHRHLHDCAYIGDDSSEEVDEAEEAAAEAEERAAALREVQAAEAGRRRGPRPAHSSAASADADHNREPAVRRRAGPDVQLLGAQAPLQSRERLSKVHAPDPDPEDGALRKILIKVAKKRAGTGRRRGDDWSKEAPVAEYALPHLSSVPETGVPSPHAAIPSSSEVFEEVLRKLRALGPRGSEVLRRLNYQMDGASDTNSSSPSPATTSDSPVDTLEDALREPGAMNAVKELVRRLLKEQQGTTEATPPGRRRRASPAPALHRFVTASDAEEQYWSAGEDEDDNRAMEEQDLQPDGIADHHMLVNDTDAGDLDSSNSEFWSSFSSSEEALLSCKGLVLNLPLHPHHDCRAAAGSDRLRFAAGRNTLTYRVPANGYYFFVFGSENEVQTNYIRAHFQLERVVYNVSSSIAACRNTTEPCALPLDFFSNEKLVLEMPVRPNASLWNEEFLVVSSCEPRTALYVACIIAVPLLIVLFAFQ